MRENLNSKNSLTIIVIIVFVSILCCRCKQSQKPKGKLVLHIDTMIQQNICEQTECLPRVLIKLSAINNTPETVMLHTNYQKGDLYRHGYFNIEMETDKSVYMRETSFLPISGDSLFNELILTQMNKKNIILGPGDRDSIELYRDIYNLSPLDSIKLSRYLKYCKIVYANKSNLDSLRVKHPTFKIIKYLLSD